MIKATLQKMQKSVLSRIYYCFCTFKQNPIQKWENNLVDENDSNKSISNIQKLSSEEQAAFNKTLYLYVSKQAVTQALLMLVINYLTALLIKGRNNQISIHHNKSIDPECIEKFESEHIDLLKRIKDFRDKYYAHVDLNWQDILKYVSFDELETCINFLIKILDCKFKEVRWNICLSDKKV